MTTNTRMYWLHALTPLHVGAGQGAGAIDLPIMRERVTGWPVVPGSAVKGVLADKRCATVENRKNDLMLRAAFGSEEAADNAGSLVFSDARIVCLPVRSLYGTFAWVTSPLALERLRRDLACAGLASGLPAYCAMGQEQMGVPVASVLPNGGRVYLEDLDLIEQSCEVAQQWVGKIKAWVFPGNPTWQEQFAKRFGVVADDTFDFLCETATEVNARVRIEDDTKTVARGALWYEESLPAESILAGIIWCDRVYPPEVATPEKLLNKYCAGPLNVQIGGKASTGKGRVTCQFTRPPTAAEGAVSGDKE